MTNNIFSMHIESGDIFYQNYNTGGNFYNFLLAQLEDQTAFVPKKFSYQNSFEKYIDFFYHRFQLMMMKKLICMLIKIPSIYLIDLMTMQKHTVTKDKKPRTLRKLKIQLACKKLKKMTDNFLLKK